MSSPPMRRADKLMSGAKLDELLSTGYCGHLASVSPDGSPYVCPLQYVWLDGRVGCTVASDKRCSFFGRRKLNRRCLAGLCRKHLWQAMSLAHRRRSRP